LAQYPSLVRRLVTLISHWEAATIEMLDRLSLDIGHIRGEIFAAEDPGTLIGIEGLGDSHAGGRAVHRLIFSSGQRIIYKPRPVALERGVFIFIQWLNKAGSTPDLMAALPLDRHTYGWVSHIDAAPCLNEAAVRRFFLRQGSNLALAYLLGATDLHYENVIAAGEYPRDRRFGNSFSRHARRWRYPRRDRRGPELARRFRLAHAIASGAHLR